MKRNFLHFLSQENAILNINGQSIGIIDQQLSPQIDIISNTQSFFVTYEPISEKQQAMPYTFVLNTQNTPQSNNEYIKIIPFPNNHYDIIMNPFYYYQISQSQILFNDTIGKFFISITSDTSSHITIYSGASIVFSLNTIALIDAIVKQKKDYLIIEGIIDSDTYQLIIIDTNNFSIVHNNIAHSVEEDNYHITSFKKLNTICKHAEICTFEFDKKQKDKYYVYEDKSIDINPALIPLAFLQCISIGDEVKAMSFLSDNLSNTNITQLQGYFGEIKDIFINRHSITPHRQNYTINSTRMRNYNFIIDNQKITDIEEVF
ncbi:MAG: hypothetical protein IJW59_03960 [Clostridia bacterium]|nr:hypothetical protein [Clostridia bacterium]